ncbi:hypothetical protein EXIGLDRAFT_733922 [Exidia glandulosa HHB12029]|uniref:Uncharacterized protein n=1 Tax=Exidia glandulosa HHB12029 TaxID=1314781 RepID=A0A165KBT2_EXIGL|nr:hypothetical protein EXIGLDRAFT_733922 [Exidia glandulosa HHB12029]
MRAGTECVYPDPKGRKRLSYKVAFEEMATKIATLEANAAEDKARILSLESKLEAVKTMKPPQAVAYGTSPPGR